MGEPFKKWFKENKKAVVGIILAALSLGLMGLLWGRFSPAPDASEDTTVPVTAAESRIPETGNDADLENGMEEILSLVENAGKVKVLINYSQGSETVVARNLTSDSVITTERDSGGGTRDQNQTETQDNVVTLRGQGGGDEPLVLFEIPPRIEGVIIVAEGGGDVKVQDALIRAASSLLGIALHKVTVLKMAPGGL